MSKHPGLILAVVIYLAAALSYFFIVPIFEAPDEWTHTGHVKYIAEGNGLPVMLPGRGIWGGQQPPLYYAGGALLVQPLELESFEGYSERTRNPHASVGYALDPGNKNNYLHAAAENFPYQGLSLTVHVLRLYSMAFGLVALVFTYFTAFELFAHQQSLTPASAAAGTRPFPILSSIASVTPAAVARSKEPPSIPPARGEVGSSPWQLKGGQVSNRSFGQSPPAPQRGVKNIKIPPSGGLGGPPETSEHPTCPPLNPWQGEAGRGSPAKLFAAFVALFVAGQPMFAFITASVANEPANIAFCAIGLWLAQRYLLVGPSPHWRRAAALGVVLGLISLSKMTGLSFGLVVVVVFLIVSITTRKQAGAAKLLWRDCFIIGLLFLIIGGWWYWHNFQLYGDFFQRGLYKIYFNVDPQPLTLSDFLYTLSTGEVSFWATFGWLNIVAPDWVYLFYRIISRVGLMGVALFIILLLVRALNRRASVDVSTYIVPLIPHLVFPAALAFSLTRLVAIEGGMQGRQILPALGSLAILIVWGWWAICLPKLRLPVLSLLLVAMVGLALWLPHTLVASAYTPAPLLTEADVPADLPRLNWTYNDEIKLIGAEVGADVVRPGERVPVTLYWQAIKPMTIDYSVFVHLIGRDYQNVGQLNSYPGLGLRPTTTLKPGQIVADTYPVLVNGGATAPARLLVNAGLFHIKEPGRPGIPAIDPAGNKVGPTVGQLKLIPHTWPEVQPPPLAEFNDNIQLADVDLHRCSNNNATCNVTFKWLAHAPPTADYTIFIQLWQDGRQIRGFDSPPLAGAYPTTLWDTAEVIIDPHPLDLSGLPPGDYRLLAGLYNLQSGQQRLPAFKDGEPLSDYAVEVGKIEVE